MAHSIIYFGTFLYPLQIFLWLWVDRQLVTVEQACLISILLLVPQLFLQLLSWKQATRQITINLNHFWQHKPIFELKFLHRKNKYLDCSLNSLNSENNNCLFVLFRLYVAFNNLSVISWQCLQGAQCLLLRCCLTEISHPKHLTWYSTQSRYTDTERQVLILSSTFLMLSTKRTSN